MTIGLDFLGIGAHKAGTTSLHEYMRTHPQLYLPEAKEQPFFSDDDGYAEGWETFSAVAFHAAPRGRRYGKITPHYLAGPVARPSGTASGEPASAVIARRIAQHFPEVRLIAMLRDPVERAVSSYWQAAVLGDESRTLDEALDAELGAGALAAARVHPTDGHLHVVGGEYGRALESYLRFFPRDQLFVGATTVLGREPMTLLADLWRFLDVDDSHVPPNLGVRYQERGTGRRIPLLATLPRVVKGTPGLRHAWNALPDGTRAAARARSRVLAHRLDQRKPRSRQPVREQPDPAVLARLRDHFAADAALLERLVGAVPGVTDR